MTFIAPTLTEDVRREASKRLGQLEAKHGIKVIFAVESGSRAWGFPSPDSDYDVRGFYVRPAADYLGLTMPPDTINPGIDGLWDVELWDVGKALRLMCFKNNATVSEWLQSPLIYDENTEVPFKLRDLLKRHATPQKAAAHYYGLGNGCYQGEIKNRPTRAEIEALPEGTQIKGFTTVNYKKYLYALRAAFCIAWIDRYLEIPPMTMPQLMSHDIMGYDVRAITQDLLKKKATMGEFEAGYRMPILDDYIEEKLAWVKSRGFDKLGPSPEFIAEANALLLEAVKS